MISNRPEVFCKKGALKNSAKITGKHLCQSLFLIKVQAEASNIIKKLELFKNTFFIKHVRWLLLKIWIQIQLQLPNLRSLFLPLASNIVNWILVSVNLSCEFELYCAPAMQRVQSSTGVYGIFIDRNLNFGSDVELCCTYRV